MIFLPCHYLLNPIKYFIFIVLIDVSEIAVILHLKNLHFLKLNSFHSWVCSATIHLQFTFSLSLESIARLISSSLFVVSVTGLNRELHLLLLRLMLGSWWWFSSCSSQKHRTRPLQLRLSSPSWLSFRSRSSTAPPMGLSSKSPTPSYSQPSPSSESAVVTPESSGSK
ncbi:BnaC09g21570D [Brassica napus]|uniref:BnaC09g21570D protein n=1 Tax=Brassica napus TaxID=3708 RepID=A0A078HMT4_BRANA|nr:BnaC09g21570D [Brassica napus]